MRFDTVTREQRLATDFDELTNSYWRDPSLAEQLDEADTAFRHFDSYVFAPRPPMRLGGTLGRDGATAAPPETDRRGPAFLAQPELLAHPLASVPVGGGAGGTTVPPEPPGLAFSFEHHMWTP